MLFTISGCQSSMRGSATDRESKYSLKKRNSHISCLPAKGSDPRACRLPLKVSDRTVNQLLNSIDESLGTRYRPGGAAPEGYDCSGYTSYLYKKHFRMLLPRTAGEQALFGTLVQKGELQPGDLLFFSIGGRVIDHVGIFLGKNRFAHAANSGVRISSLEESYFSQRYILASRIISPE